MSSPQKILFLILLLFSLKLYNYFIKKITFYLNNSRTLSRVEQGLVSRKDLSVVPESIFSDWCLNLLENLGFKNLQFLDFCTGDYIQLLAYKNLKKFYVLCACKNQLDSGGEDDFEKINLPEVQKLVGAMEHDNIKHGYFITTGDFAKDSREYAKTLPSEKPSLTLIDGCELTRLHRNIKYPGFKASLEVEVK